MCVLVKCECVRRARASLRHASWRRARYFCENSGAKTDLRHTADVLRQTSTSSGTDGLEYPVQAPIPGQVDCTTSESSRSGTCPPHVPATTALGAQRCRDRQTSTEATAGPASGKRSDDRRAASQRRGPGMRSRRIRERERAGGRLTRSPSPGVRKSRRRPSIRRKSRVPPGLAGGGPPEGRSCGPPGPAH